MTFGHPPPDPLPLRTRLIERLTHLDDLVRGGLDSCFSGTEDPEYRYAWRVQIQEYMAQAEQYLTDWSADLPDQVFMDVPVQVVDEETGELETFTVVGPNEADAMSGRVSFMSPLGSALLLRRVGDAITVDAPGGQFVYRIVSLG